MLSKGIGSMQLKLVTNLPAICALFLSASANQPSTCGSSGGGGGKLTLPGAISQVPFRAPYPEPLNATTLPVGDPSDSGINGSSGSVFLGNGSSFMWQSDFALSLSGLDWHHERMFSSQSSSSDTWQGEGWWSNPMMNITVDGADGASDVTWEFDPHYSFLFEWDTNVFSYKDAADNYPFSIAFNSGNDEYVITRYDGFKWTFHDANVANNPGELKSIEDPFGNDWSFTYSSGQLAYIVVDVVDGNDHKITYSYFTSGDNSGKLQYIKVYKSTTTTDANLIGQVEHVYHDSTSDSYGSQGDLMKVIVSRKATADGDGSLSIEETYHYRYYKGTYDSDTNPGTDHQLRYVLLPENAQRLNDDIGTPMSQSNTDWESYANVIYEYDSSGRVRQTEERLPGGGCGCSGAGGSITEYTWSVNGGSPDLDTWNIHCVANRADDTRVIFDTNYRYQILSWVVQDEDDGTPTKELIWHFDYGTSGSTANRMTAAYNPSACSAYDESSPYGVTLNSSSGVVHTIEYQYGYPQKIRIQEGSSGTPDTLIEYARTLGGLNGPRRDLPTSITVYESGSEGDGRTKTLSYSFYDTTTRKQLKELDITYPSVSTDNNGPGSSAVEKRYFDKRTGELRWILDGEGYVDFYAYDDETGLQDLVVKDANTSSLATVIDDNWDGVTHGGLGADDTVPFSRTGTGSALDIDSSVDYDWLGRVRKATDAGGMIIYHVYNDDEMRTYPAWDTTTYTTLLPFQVNKTDKDGRVEDTLMVDTGITPSKDGSNEPTGTESYTNADLASRTVTTYNVSGMVENVQRYHTFPGSGDGTRYTNYYQTDTEYDSMGRVEYVIEDVSDESTYDREQVTQYTYDFVGRRIKVQEAVSDETHDIGSGKPTMITKAEYFYDDPDSDSTPEQGEGDGNLNWVRSYYGSSSYNDTEYRYDWRNRRQLIIPALRPYILIKHDNLDRAITIGTYSATTNLDPGDDPATTENGNRLDLSKTYFDEMGRLYRTERYDDPGDATPEDELASNVYYDRRSFVWASDPANTGTTFTKYDGLGRRIQTSSGTQFDSAKYSSDAPDYPDDDEGIFQLTDYTLDDGGNVQKVITKELNHDDTDGIDLTNNDDYIRTYVYNYYDDADRLIDTVRYGTNNAGGWKDSSTAPTYGSSAPARSDTVLVTTYEYDAEGRRNKVKDPRGIVTLSVYDELGRVTQKEEDDAGTDERITKYEYNGQGSLTKITADLTTDQVTEYVYGDSQNARWVTKIKYPATDTDNGKTKGQPSDETYDRIVFTYNVDGTLATRTDQNGTVLTWSYDALRRKTEEEVTTLGSYTGGSGSVNGAVRAVTWTYDDKARVEYLTTHTDATPDTSTWTDAANQIKYTYNAADRLTKEEQEEDGAVDGSTLAVDYGYGTDYSTGHYNRRDWIEYPDGRKIWFGYTHSDTANTLQDTINDKFNRIGQIARDSSGTIGDLLAEYDFNGRGRQVRRVHDEDSGAYGNDTRMDLWHGTSGQYDGLDRFGRVVNMKHTDMSGTAFLGREYTHDRNSNRESIKHTLHKAESQSFTYDNLNRLTKAERGFLDSNDDVQTSNMYEDFGMDLLGNFTSGEGGIKLNDTDTTLYQTVNETNEITSVTRPNRSEPAQPIKEDFSSLSDYWSQEKGTWSVSSNEANVDTLDGNSEAMILAGSEIFVANMGFAVKEPSSVSGFKAGVVFGHDGNNSYYALVLSSSDMGLYKVTNGTWGSALASSSGGGSSTSQFTGVSVTIHGRRVRAVQYDPLIFPSIAASLSYDSSTEFGVGETGLYANKTSTKFSSFDVYQREARDSKTTRISGLSAASRDSGNNALEIDNRISTVLGTVEIGNFYEDDFILQANVDFQTYDPATVWFRCSDIDNCYRFDVDDSLNAYLYKYEDGKSTLMSSGTYTGGTAPHALKIKTSGTSIKIWFRSTLVFDVTDSTHEAGRVFLDGFQPLFEDIKIGYDNNADDDIDDAGDDIVVDETFSSNDVTMAHDHAGNLVDDGNFRYTYDAWNQLVKVEGSADSGAETFQTAEFDGLGRRIKKVVANTGDLDGTTVYLYNGQQIIETRDGSNNMVQQFIHGTQYIDELVMVRVASKGDLYVHQDANWNVIGLTDLGGHFVERYAYTPYGELTVHQETGYGDRDGDGDVDSDDKGTPGTDCTGTVSGDCRILDLDFDGDYDSTDATAFDSLPQGLAQHPGRTVTAVDQPFAHQGLLYDAELMSYQNRARQYDPNKRRFVQRDPLYTMNWAFLFARESIGSEDTSQLETIDFDLIEAVSVEFTYPVFFAHLFYQSERRELVTHTLRSLMASGDDSDVLGLYAYQRNSPVNRLDSTGLVSMGAPFLTPLTLCFIQSVNDCEPICTGRLKHYCKKCVTVFFQQCYKQ